MSEPAEFDADLLTQRSDPAWCTAVPDWEERILSRRSLVPDLPLNVDLADKAERVFNRLRIPDIMGQPTFGEVGGPWFIEIVRTLFGAYDPETDVRHIQEFFLMVPKKNAKTTNAAGIMVTALILNPVHMASAAVIAPTKEIADLGFGQAKGMIRADAELRKKFHIQEHKRQITHRESGAYLKVKAADTDAVTGTKDRYTLIDEVHVFGRNARAAEVFLELRGALTASPGGFLGMITTQSKEPPAGVFKAELDRARAVRDGKIRAPVLSVLYELPQRMQETPRDGTTAPWRDPKTFALVNPNLGRSARPEFLISQLQEKEEEGNEALALFASQHLDVEIGIALNSDGWAGAPHWHRGIETGLTLDNLLARCDVATVGLDGGGLDDLLGIGVVGRERETRRWLGWAHALISPEGLERRKANAPKYREFMKEGSLTLVDGLPADLAAIQDIVKRIRAARRLSQVGVDPAGIGGIVDALDDIDVTQDNGLLTGVAQGIRLMGAAKTLERKLVDGSFGHDGSALMTWCVGNAKVRQTSTAVLIERSASGYGKIDPFMALLNAAHLMSLNPKPRQIGYVRGQIFGRTAA